MSELNYHVYFIHGSLGKCECELRAKFDLWDDAAAWIDSQSAKNIYNENFLLVDRTILKEKINV